MKDLLEDSGYSSNHLLVMCRIRAGASDLEAPKLGNWGNAEKLDDGFI
jgi:hypothetical protein